MSTLISRRIRDHALKLGMPHLADNLAEVTDRADAAQLGYLDFLDRCRLP